MWWCKRLSAVLFLCGLLAACGFQPLYGDGAVGAAGHDKVEIANIPDRDGQMLRNLLIDRLHRDGQPTDAAYMLTIQPLKKSVANMGIRKDATYTRAILQFTGEMKLVEKNTGRVVLTRALRASGGYNLLDDQFGTLISEQSVTEHALSELSDTIVTELDLYFRRAQ